MYLHRSLAPAWTKEPTELWLLVGASETDAALFLLRVWIWAVLGWVCGVGVRASGGGLVLLISCRRSGFRERLRLHWMFSLLGWGRMNGPLP